MRNTKANETTIDGKHGAIETQGSRSLVSNISEKGLYKECEAAKLLGMSVYWMQRMRHIGGGPSYVKIGAAVRYRRDMLEKYIAENTCSSTSEYKNEN